MLYTGWSGFEMIWIKPKYLIGFEPTSVRQNGQAIEFTTGCVENVLTYVLSDREDKQGIKTSIGLNIC